VGKRPFVRVQVAGTTLDALFDTGAGPTCVSTDTFATAKKAGQIKKNPDQPDIVVYNASGQKMHQKGSYLMTCTVLGHTIDIPVLVIPQLHNDMIVGMNLIDLLKLYYDPHTQTVKVHSRKSVHASGLSPLGIDIIPTKDTQLPPGHASRVRLQAVERVTERPIQEGTEICCTINSIPVLVRTEASGRFSVMCSNPTNSFINLQANQPCAQEVYPYCPEELTDLPLGTTSVSALDTDQVKSHLKEELIEQAVRNTEAEPITKAQLHHILSTYQDAISAHEFDLGQSPLLKHSIALRHHEPIYSKQYPLPAQYIDKIKESIKEWSKLGVIEPAHSKYNSPLFLVPKKDKGGMRICQDYRQINAASLPDKYSIRTVNDCIAEIGAHNATCFAAIDLRHSFYQMELEEESRPLSAFTIPGLGQFQWKVGAMGLAGCPASFSRLMDTAMRGLPNVITYVDDLLIYATSPEQLLQVLQSVMVRLKEHKLKINLPKCKFLANELQYLGHTLTPKGIRPSKDKVQDLIMAPAPTTLTQVRSFLGLANFFREYVPNFAHIAQPLNALTKKDAQWKKGPIPQEAEQARLKLLDAITKRPTLAYPSASGRFHLYIDGSTGLRGKPGGLGAHLCQEQNGKLRSVAFASRQLVQHENNYTAFMIEVQAAWFAIHTFQHHLKGRHFILHTDHKPMVPHTTMQTRTLNRLHQLLLEFDFEVHHVSGEANAVADFLSRNPPTQVAAISHPPINDIAAAQQADPFIQEAIKAAKQLPHTPQAMGPLVNWLPNLQVHQDILYVSLKGRKGFMEQSSLLRIVAPDSMKAQLIAKAHNHPQGTHLGVSRTMEAIRQHMWWPNMTDDIQAFIQRCQACQTTQPRRPEMPPGYFPPPPGPNHRVHADLFGPVKDAAGDKSFILVITDAFSRLVSLESIPSKSAEDTAHALLQGWCYIYGIPKVFVTDQGKEFCNEVQERLWQQLEVNHRTTTPYHPQCNGQAENFNKTMAHMLRTAMQQNQMPTTTVRSWLKQIAFAYNTSCHTVTQQEPFITTFGYPARQPTWPPEHAHLLEPPASTGQQVLQQRHDARAAANQNTQHDRDVRHTQLPLPQAFTNGQPVWVWRNVSTDPNKKLDTKWIPGIIQEAISNTTYKVKKEGSRGRPMVVNQSHLRARWDSTNNPTQEPDEPQLPLATQGPLPPQAQLPQQALMSQPKMSSTTQPQSPPLKWPWLTPQHGQGGSAPRLR